MALRTFKSNKQTKHGVWITEIRLRDITPSRMTKLNKLLALLKETVREVPNG